MNNGGDVLAGMTWGMSPAQVCAMQMCAMYNTTVVKAEISKDEKFLVEIPHTQTYMLGIPVDVDPDLPSSVVQLKYKGAVIFTFENIAVPQGFEN